MVQCSPVYRLVPISLFISYVLSHQQIYLEEVKYISFLSLWDD